MHNVLLLIQLTTLTVAYCAINFSLNKIIKNYNPKSSKHHGPPTRRCRGGLSLRTFCSANDCFSWNVIFCLYSRGFNVPIGLCTVCVRDKDYIWTTMVGLKMASTVRSECLAKKPFFLSNVVFTCKYTNVV